MGEHFASIFGSSAGIGAYCVCLEGQVVQGEVAVHAEWRRNHESISERDICNNSTEIVQQNFGAHLCILNTLGRNSLRSDNTYDP